MQQQDTPEQVIPAINADSGLAPSRGFIWQFLVRVRKEHQIERWRITLSCVVEGQSKSPCDLSLLTVLVAENVSGKHLIQSSHRAGEVIPHPDLALRLGFWSVICGG